MDKLSPSERRGIALVFVTACLAFFAWAYPNMSRLVTIPGAVLCLLGAAYFLWPEIKDFVSSALRQRVAVTASIGISLCVALGGLARYLTLRPPTVPEIGGGTIFTTALFDL